MKKSDIGIIGLAVMGQNLVLNMESEGYKVSVYNRTDSKTEKFYENRAHNKNIVPTFSLSEFISSLARPRKIMLMVKAGKPVDIFIDKILSLLEEGDIIIDGGNSHFKDTERRIEMLKKKGILYLGTGISGGEYGALHGPSIMPGGSEKAYKELEPILTDVAAKTEDGPCVTYLGPGGSGHYVKMIHNGIEYGVMQVIAEAYDMMRKALNMEPGEMSEIIKEWNKEHEAYLLDITYEILKKNDSDTGQPLINIILDNAKQKGTGKWSAQEALELGIPIPTIEAAVNMRYFSSRKGERLKVGKTFKKSYEIVKDKKQFLADLKNGVYLGIVTAYAEGLKLLQAASKEYNFSLNYSKIARIWENGCIIRSSLLKYIQDAFYNKPDLTDLIVSAQFKDEYKERIQSLRQVVSKSVKLGIPFSSMAGALSYFDSLSSQELPANLIQGQRDYFGAHTYQRRDQEGKFHTEWQDIHNIS